MGTGTQRLALSAERYSAIVSALRSDGGRRYDEKRGRPRVGLRGRVEIEPILPSGKRLAKFDVWVRNLSARGIGILHDRPLRVGTRFNAIFHRPGASPMVLSYVVAQVKSVDDGMYTMGAHLVGVGDLA